MQISGAAATKDVAGMIGAAGVWPDIRPAAPLPTIPVTDGARRGPPVPVSLQSSRGHRRPERSSSSSGKRAWMRASSAWTDADSSGGPSLSAGSVDRRSG
jgi:hypothetical protein